MLKRFRLLLITASIIVIILLGIYIINPVTGSSPVTIQNSSNNFIIPTKLTKQWIILDSLFGDYHGIAIGSNDSVYVVNSNGAEIKKIYPNWRSIDLGTGFSHPQGVAVDNKGNLYVADTGNDAVKMIYPNGSIKTIGSGFKAPYGVAVDSLGDVYVADTYNQAVKMIYPNNTVVRLGNLLDPYSGDQNNYISVMNSGMVFDEPQGVAVDDQGNVYVANFYGGVNKIYPNNTTIWLAQDHPFRNLQGIAVDALGNVYVSERNNNSVDIIYPNGTLVALGGFIHPSGVAVDAQGNLYIVDDYTISELSSTTAGILPYINWVGNLLVWILVPLSPVFVFTLVYLITFGKKNKWHALRSIARLYLKIYLVSGITFIITYLLFSYILRFFTGMVFIGLPLVLSAGVLFGLFMALISGTYHLGRIESKYHSISDETLNISHVREITLDLPYNDAFGICVSSLKDMKSGKIRLEERETGKIEARTPWYGRFGNEKITFKIHRESDNVTKIRVETRPIMPFTLVDYGKNLDDIETICKYIKNHNGQPGKENEVL